LYSLSVSPSHFLNNHDFFLAHAKPFLLEKLAANLPGHFFPAAAGRIRPDKEGCPWSDFNTNYHLFNQS